MHFLDVMKRRERARMIVGRYRREISRDRDVFPESFLLIVLTTSKSSQHPNFTISPLRATLFGTVELGVQNGIVCGTLSSLRPASQPRCGKGVRLPSCQQAEFADCRRSRSKSDATQKDDMAHSGAQTDGLTSLRSDHLTTLARGAQTAPAMQEGQPIMAE